MTDTIYTNPVTTSRPPAIRQIPQKAANASPAVPVQKGPAASPLYDGLPPATALLGQSQDDLPVLFDLSDPRPGPLLVLGNDDTGKTRLMQQIAFSLMQNNKPEKFQFSVIGFRAGRWRELIAQSRQTNAWQELSSGKKPDPGEQIIRAAELAEQKYITNQVDPAVVIFMDDLSFMYNQGTDVQLNFEWLCKHGPQVQVWLVAALETEAALSMGRWTRYFRTRIIGEMPQKASNRLGLYADSYAEDFVPGMDFAVFINDAWLKFQLINSNPTTVENNA